MPRNASTEFFLLHVFRPFLFSNRTDFSKVNSESSVEDYRWMDIHLIEDTWRRSGNWILTNLTKSNLLERECLKESRKRVDWDAHVSRSLMNRLIWVEDTIWKWNFNKRSNYWKIFYFFFLLNELKRRLIAFKRINC